MIFHDLAVNAALLLTLALLYTFISRRWKGEKRIEQLFHGFLFGGVALGVMISPMHLMPGVVFDTRSIVVSMAGLFGGPAAAAVSVIMAGTYRTYQGGVGAFTGVLVICVSAGLGIGYHYLRQRYSEAMKPLYLFTFGIVVHLVMLLCMFTLPWPLAFQVLKEISLPVLLIYPVGSFLLAILLAERETHIETEGALLESEKRYRLLVESSSDAILMMDKSRKIVSCNRSFLALFGYAADEAIGQSIRMIHPSTESYRSFGEAAYPEIERSGSFRTEWDFLRRDGTRFPVETTTSAIQSSGEITGYVAIIRDITERKRTEQMLQESEERYRGIFDESVAAIYIFDNDKHFMESNQAGLDLLGYSRDELLKMSIPDVDVNQVKVLPAHEQLLSGNRIINYEHQLRRKGGEIITVLNNSRPITDKVGQIVGMQSTLIDITERKKAEEDRERLMSAIEQTAEAIVITDTEPKILYVNPAFERITGYSYKEAKGQNPRLLKSGKQDKVFYRNMWDTLLRGDVWKGRFVNKKKDGTLFTEESVISPVLDASRRTISYVAAKRDITKQIKLEEQLRQAQKMEAVGTLAGGIAHDFNNLLMGMQGHVSLMQIGKAASHPDMAHLKDVEERIKSAADLTRQLLGFARGGQYEVKPTDLNGLVQKSIDLFGPTRKEITIHKKSQKEIWTVKVDQGQIEQTLLNLYINAWQAMSGGGELFIETENVTLDEAYAKPHGVEAGRYVKISVTDTGIGMDAATQKRIFDPFFTTKEMGRGTGMGLASAYGIIQNHGGIIHVYSEKGKGATFTIYLPATDATGIAQRAESERSGEVLRGRETILLVDDEEMILEVGRDLLASLGYRVLSARSGREAIEIVSKAYRAWSTAKKGEERFAPGAMPPAPDLVILDMIMPEMGGSETYDKLKEIDPDIKVLLSSGYSINGPAKEILDRGCNGFIQKPFGLKDLSHRLREILDPN